MTSGIQEHKQAILNKVNTKDDIRYTTAQADYNKQSEHQGCHQVKKQNKQAITEKVNTPSLTSGIQQHKQDIINTVSIKVLSRIQRHKQAIMNKMNTKDDFRYTKAQAGYNKQSEHQ